MQQEQGTSLVDLKTKLARPSHLLVILGAHAQFCLLTGVTVVHWHGQSTFLGVEVAWWVQQEKGR